MAERCVFLDRDHTIIEDPGYLTEPSAVKLMPGVDVALRSLAAAGFKLVVVTNQSGIARGMLTEESLERIHAEMRRQLEERGVHLDGIYYCPYHPEGTVDAYARESEDRKPQPGMLLRAAADLSIDLGVSWMVGDSPRDMEAGQRAGCRTIRIRIKGEEGAEDKAAHRALEPKQDEDVQADHTVRNLVDAARVILREIAVSAATGAKGFDAAGKDDTSIRPAIRTAAPRRGRPRPENMSDSQVLREILHHLRRMSPAGRGEEFSLSRLLGTVFQILAVIAVVVGMIALPSAGGDSGRTVAQLALLLGGVLQLFALTFLLLWRRQ